ncbi:hypothetical protein CEUSTIGMA_g2482.t1 [Chlamydomonas eustigma]|uniref:Cytosine-specific methyltransferase n=1 Tax=Chlamydomonas eustigma TaxID=1157962 RepID=A0A250WW31_9CHLO|nr:hypothetical protein CEUSTIGMA_g2482.t1 [Chlamydomonas eustigma]|eukprot:GAX75038.1 hypothetical protein CEUSTIGMA_g2482.t1 [Chlamydomonas eustigma]
MSVPMATKDELEKWKDMGGKVETCTKKGAKTTSAIYVTPSGEKLKSWDDAVKLIEAGVNSEVSFKDIKEQGSKRGKENIATVNSLKDTVKEVAKKQRMAVNDNSKKRKEITEIPPAMKAEQGPPLDANLLSVASMAPEACQSKKKRAGPAKAGSKTTETTSDLIEKTGAEIEDALGAPAVKTDMSAGPVKKTTSNKGGPSGTATGNETKATPDVKEEGEQQQAQVRVGSGRQAAQGKKYKEKGAGRSMAKDDMLVVIEEQECETEAAALEQTSGSGAKRRLVDFSIKGQDGLPLGVDRISFAPGQIMVSGVVYPEDGDLIKSRGRRVVEFGPVKDWKIIYSGSGTGVQIKTSLALYELSRPAQRYRKAFSDLQEQLEISGVVYSALSSDQGGAITATLDEVVAKMARAKVGRGYGSTRDALLLNGKFILQQLKVMSEQQLSKSAKTAVSFHTAPFATALEAEVAKGFNVGPGIMTNGIRIMDSSTEAEEAAEQDQAGPGDAMMQADEEFARKLQAKMMAQAHGAGGRNGGAKNAASAYIRISPEEIADDYPVPASYEKEEEEVDEMLLFDEEMVDADPEYLPRRVLHDFAVYNAEGMYSTLELVPMWSGVDHDVEIFASGIVTEDDGDWDVKEAGAVAEAAGESGAGGRSGAGGGSSSAAAAADAVEGGSSSAASSGGSGVASAAAVPKPQGMRLYLSQIREWVVECGCETLSISIRTDVAWYRLAMPTTKYSPWFRTVLKAARVAVFTLGLLSAEARASRLSFADVVRRIAEQPEGSPSYIGKKVDNVERFVVVHGQVILNQFKHYPNKAVQKAAFVSELRLKMEARKHSKLYMTKAKAKAAVKVRNSNPMRNKIAIGLRAKPMAATATTLVKAVWHGYFFGAKRPAGDQEEGKEEEGVAAAAGVAEEVEEDMNEEDDAAAEETALAGGTTASHKNGHKSAVAKLSDKKAVLNKPTKPKVKLVGPEIKKDASGRSLHRSAQVGDLQVCLGAVVSFNDGDSDEEQDSTTAEEFPLGRVVALYKDKNGDNRVQLRTMLRASETVLGDAGGEWELFLSEDLEEVDLQEVCGSVKVERLQRSWSWDLRGAHLKEDAEFRKLNEEAKAAGNQGKYFYRHLYCPEKGMFCTIPDTIEHINGDFIEPPKEAEPLTVSDDGLNYTINGHNYSVGEFVYLDPYTFSKQGLGLQKSQGLRAKKNKKGGKKGELEEEDEDESDGEVSEKEAEEKEEEEVQAPEYARKSGKHKGSNAGLKAFVVAQITGVNIETAKNGKRMPRALKVRRMYRPEDVGSKDVSYESEWWEVYAGPASQPDEIVDLEKLVGKCHVQLMGASTKKPGAYFQDTFICTGSFDPCKPGVVASPPSTLDFTAASSKAEGTAAKSKGSKAKGAGKDSSKAALPNAATSSQHGDTLEEFEECSAVAMATMDIFAGCGGLSEGMHQAGVADTKWGVEYEPTAAEAFKKNNPEATVFCNNCNVLLRAAMEKANLSEDCDACDDCMDAAARLSAEDRAALPLPGQVEFIMGGPPCQGYSGMNRFNKSNWSLVQNSMVMSFLSYCEFYRPRYFLLENVRNFVSHNKSFTFRLTLRTLLEMGYQVRFGVLNAGNYGVPQSRKRTIIWAAAPGEVLPEWPTPTHVFHSPQLTINLPGGVQYTAVPNQVGAPLRAVTVRDAIFDLPAIQNGHNQEVMEYKPSKTSAYQRFIRGRASTHIQDHVCKEMNELNLERCKCIPKGQPGADWRVLQEIVKEHPEKAEFKGQPLVPWCLPNTADRHNGWRGLFGRLDPSGHFPTSTTDPQPMGKVGQVFHPEQNRIVSVRECARSQGFPDHFQFAGNVHNKHRQVGNAVPPPLAAALGRRLRKVLEEKRSTDVAASLAAQLGL